MARDPKGTPEADAEARPRPIGLPDIALAIRSGWISFRAVPAVSAAYSSVAAWIGLVLLAVLGNYGLSPLSLALAGGFMLVAPAMLTGFFHVARMLEQGVKPRLVDPFSGFLHAPAGVWLVALFCAFLFVIWITDAGVLYGFMIGGEHLPYQLPWLVPPKPQVLAFWFWGSLMGSVLAFIIFTVSAFSVPLLFEGRMRLVSAVHASVRAVFKSLLPCVVWAVLLTVCVIGAIVLLPLLPVVLPVLAFASFALYRTVFGSG